MILLAVNHHYFAEEAPAAARAIFPTTVAAFERELELLAAEYEFVSRDQLVAAAQGEAELPGRACAITLDDGLRSQFELALPVLDRLGVPAIFFVPGAPIAEGRALLVHKIHALRERIGDDELLARIGDHDVEESASAMYGFDAPAAAQVKYLLNIALEPDVREALVDDLFGDDETFASELYMDRSQIDELERRGLVAAHAWAHRPLAQVDDGDLCAELERSAALYASHPRAISYPYGTPDAVDERVAQAASEAGFVVGFTMEPAYNRTLEQPLLLARIDVNDAPGGSHANPDRIAACRSRYFAESERLR